MRWLACLALCAALGFGQASDFQIAIHARAAQDAQKAQDFATAVREYEILSRLLPDSAEVQSNLGIALYFHKETERALAALKKASEMNPRLATPHLFAGFAWRRLSNPDAAAPELEKAVDLKGADPLARLWLGYTYADQSRYDAAVQQFQKASELDPNNIDTWYALGETYLHLGKAATVRLLAIAPDGGRAWELAGEQFQLQNDRQQALVLFEGALRRRPDLKELCAIVRDLGGHPEVTTRVSTSAAASEEDRFYYQAHDLEQRARASFERVVQLAPDSYQAHQILADTYMAQQQFESTAS